MSDIPRIFGQYEILDVIGSGGMAKVYRARQLNIERDVAIKIMSTALSDQEEFQVRFKREADVFAKLEHPHILPIYDYGKYESYIYLVLRLMEGGTLEKMARGQKIALTDLDRFVAQVASALDYAHQNDIVHRDLKPNNILLDKFGNSYLMDFGIAKIVSEAQSANMSTMLGTPAYMAPEQWRMEPIDGGVDIYSLGVMIYEMLTGKMPFNGHTPYHLMYAHLHEEATLPSMIISDLSPEIDSVLLKALAKDRRARYQTATELAKDLSKAIQDQQRDTRGDVASLADSSESAITRKSSVKSEMIGSILLALDRPNRRIYAVPKVEDFVDLVSKKNIQSSGSSGKRFETWRMDDILQELEESPPTSNIDTFRLKSMFTSADHKPQTYLGVETYAVRLPENLAAQSGREHGLLVAEVKANSIAQRIGLILGDTLVTLDGMPLRSQDDLGALLSGDRVGKTVVIRYIRAGELLKTTAVLE